MNRVVVTGIGVETCAGRHADEFWASVRDGRSAIRPIRSFDASRIGCKVAGEVDFDPGDRLTRTQTRRTSRFQQLHYSAVVGALEHAGDPPVRGSEFGIFVGTSVGGLPAMPGYWKIRDEEIIAADRLVLTKVVPNAAAYLTAEMLGVTGPSVTFATGCVASTNAVAAGFREIQAGRLRGAVVSGVEAWIMEFGVAVFARMGMTSRCPPERATEACRPFDDARDGLVPAEGAGALVLEELSAAEQRGGPILAEIVGAGASCDATHPVRPCDDGRVAAQAISSALHDAGVGVEAVDHVNGHGSSTLQSDSAETRAIRAALGRHANAVTVSAPKSVFGYHMGACGVVETAAAVLTLAYQFVPPTANLEHPDPKCDLDYVACVGRPARVDHALKLNFGLGGQNSALVLRRYGEVAEHPRAHRDRPVPVQ